MSLTAPSVVLRLLDDDLRLPPDYQVEFIYHEVSVNWRQLHTTPREQIDAIGESLVHHGPFGGTWIPVGDLPQALSQLLARAAAAVSLTSRIRDGHGNPVGHLALMNLHPEGFNDPEELAAAVKQIVGDQRGYLLDSGRHYHYYGVAVLTHERWHAFLAQFLMPCVLVSPRYIGHSLHRGFCTLRLNAVPPFKPKQPVVHFGDS